MPSGMRSMCGIDCTRCKTFRATAGDDDGLCGEVQAYYKEIGIDIAIEDLRCCGCGSQAQMARLRRLPLPEMRQGKGPCLL